MDEPKQTKLTQATDSLQIREPWSQGNETPIPVANEPRPMTAREKGLADGYRQALRECAIDLKAALKAKGDPEFRQHCIECVLDWFEEAASGD